MMFCVSEPLNSNWLGSIASELGKVNIPQDLVGNEGRWSYMKTPKTPKKKMLTATFPYDAVESSLPAPPQSKRKHRQQKSLSGSITKRYINWDFDAVQKQLNIRALCF